jgi:hypothetical protein
MNIQIEDIRKALHCDLHRTNAWMILLDKLEEIDARLNKLEGNSRSIDCCEESCAANSH